MLEPSGNIITSASNFEEHFINPYKKVLGNRTIKPSWENHQIMKEKLLKERFKLTKVIKSEPWTSEDLDTVLKTSQKR